jgi:hypothetical protein
MPGLEPGIHVFRASSKDVDGRAKPGHDEFGTSPAMTVLTRAFGATRPGITIRDWMQRL